MDLSYFQKLSQAKILVVGDVMLDRYWHGDTGRISPEAPVPVVKVSKLEDKAGGACSGEEEGQGKGLSRGFRERSIPSG